MPEFTTNQWAVLGLVLVLGWLLGLLSRNGKAHQWQREFEAEHAERASLERQLKAANERILELERQTYPVNPNTTSVIGAAARGERDDLALINGVGRNGEMRLNALGIYRYRDIIDLHGPEERELEDRLGMENGSIEREHWRDQAILLRDGKVTEKEKQFG